MYYKEVKGASKDVVLGYVTFTDSAKKASITLIKCSNSSTCIYEHTVQFNLLSNNPLISY